MLGWSLFFMFASGSLVTYYMIISYFLHDQQLPSLQVLTKPLKATKNWVICCHSYKYVLFLCIRPSVSKLKNHIVFFIHQKKKQCFIMHFGFNNQFIKVKRTLAKISKTNKNFILFCFNIRNYEFIRKTYSWY
jgi:hypothetical protein